MRIIVAANVAAKIALRAQPAAHLVMNLIGSRKLAISPWRFIDERIDPGGNGQPIDRTGEKPSRTCI